MSNETNDWHFARPELAKCYIEIFNVGLTSARGLFARRRMGKTEFLKKDFMPAAEKAGYMTVYINLWDLEFDPATTIVTELYRTIEPKGFQRILKSFSTSLEKIKASGKVAVIEGSVEADFSKAEKIKGSLLTESMAAFDKKKKSLMLIIDEAQVLTYEENTKFAHALRSALDVRKERIKVIFAGSSETTLRRMFGVSSEPFYNWAPLEPFQLLGEEFVKAMVKKVNQICKMPLTEKEALEAFAELKNTPEFFRRYIEQYICNPQKGSIEALKITKSNVFNDDTFKRQWDSLLAADQIILTMVANGKSDLHGKSTLNQIGKTLGVSNVNKNTTHNSLRRLMDKCILTKIGYGQYQFEDEAFSDWVKHNG